MTAGHELAFPIHIWEDPDILILDPVNLEIDPLVSKLDPESIFITALGAGMLELLDEKKDFHAGDGVCFSIELLLGI